MLVCQGMSTIEIAAQSGIASNTVQDHLKSLLAALARRRRQGLLLGITTTGPNQANTIRRALDVRVDGVPLFSSVQATWNVLEPSTGPALGEASAAGWAVIVKEAVANGRLTRIGDAGSPDGPLGRASAALGVEPDALAIAAVLAQPWVSVVLSGAASVNQLASNLRAVDVAAAEVPDIAESAEEYWAARSARPWT